MPAPVLHRRARDVLLGALVPIIGLVPGVLVAQSSAEAAPPADRAAYRPPVDAPVVDPFRAPPHPFGPGNRGLDYGTDPLTPVRAAADGEVIFAGPVAGTGHVTIRHADGLRTSYSFLSAVTVRSGQRVRAGDVVGLSIEVVHFGVRDPTGTYLDPATLFAAARGARLVPGGDDGTLAGPPERRVLEGVVAARAAPVAARLAALAPTPTPPGALDRSRLWAHTLTEASSAPHRARVRDGLVAWAAERAPCTPPEVMPPLPAARRILVQVAGIGSTSERAAVADVEWAALGYAPGDVVRFSYAGGRVPGTAAAATGSLGEIAATRYTARDSHGDLRAAASRLAGLLGEIARIEPGVPIDVVAHSQGGVVARLALRDARSGGAMPPEVETLVTLGTPHQGADVANAVQAGRLTGRGRALMASVRAALAIELDADLPAAAQLAPTSELIDELRSLPPPPSVRLVSVGARGDVVVTANRTVVAGAASTVVPLTGPSAHDRLPASPAATREVALAIAGRPPTCRTFSQVATDLVVSERLSQLESALALATAAAASTAGLGER